ncbi:hypothetical protein HNR46_004235 [Haloferula luteola]|uniref:Lipoprotein n=1 Tax=Haloferula luteola TaxID=595692 RepID=A0A840VEN3_9BACT|nr:hypothetical protein [Haloferula luteola]MBB5353964.1 hypothetical protein [Haloferula luteola]
MRSIVGALSLTLLACQNRPDGSTYQKATSGLFGKSAKEVEITIGQPADAWTAEPGGPFPELTRVLSYYTEDSDGAIRRQDYWIGSKGVYSAPNWSKDERILSPKIPEDRRKIEAFRSDQQEAQQAGDGDA